MGDAETHITQQDIQELREEIEQLESQVFGNGLQALVEANTRVLEANAKIMQRLVVVIDGDEDLDVAGLRDRVKHVEAATESYERDRDRIKWVTVGLGASSLGQIGLLAGIVSKLFGA